MVCGLRSVVCAEVVAIYPMRDRENTGTSRLITCSVLYGPVCFYCAGPIEFLIENYVHKENVTNTACEII